MWPVGYINSKFMFRKSDAIQGDFFPNAFGKHKEDDCQVILFAFANHPYKITTFSLCNSSSALLPGTLAVTNTYSLLLYFDRMAKHCLTGSVKLYFTSGIITPGKTHLQALFDNMAISHIGETCLSHTGQLDQ